MISSNNSDEKLERVEIALEAYVNEFEDPDMDVAERHIVLEALLKDIIYWCDHNEVDFALALKHVCEEYDNEQEV